VFLYAPDSFGRPDDLRAIDEAHARGLMVSRRRHNHFGLM
jgi:1,4-alpha-glucan branching enzyme